MARKATKPICGRPGHGANVLRALSAGPDAVRDWIALASAQDLSRSGMANYVRDPNRALDRVQMELIAGRVSGINQGFY